MRKVILIGDSIRIGYQPYVRRLLAGWAEVWGPTSNVFSSSNVLAQLDEWLAGPLAGERDAIVHINAGLHDIRRNRQTQLIETSLDRYRTNIESIIEFLQSPGHRLPMIWARTTPVNFERHGGRKPFDRMEADVETYNTVADAIMAREGVPTNDLFGLVMQRGRDEMLTDDGVHYSADGYEELGRGVAARIREVVHASVGPN